MPENKAAHFPVKWLITIVDRGRGEMAAELLNQVHKSVHMSVWARGPPVLKSWIIWAWMNRKRILS